MSFYKRTTKVDPHNQAIIIQKNCRGARPGGWLIFQRERTESTWFFMDLIKLVQNRAGAASLSLPGSSTSGRKSLLRK
jgi:hypothetical protein